MSNQEKDRKKLALFLKLLRTGGTVIEEKNVGSERHGMMCELKAWVPSARSKHRARLSVSWDFGYSTDDIIAAKVNNEDISRKKLDSSLFIFGISLQPAARVRDEP